MDLLKEDLVREAGKIKQKLDNSAELSSEDLKILLLNLLQEEDLNEGK